MIKLKTQALWKYITGLFLLAVIVACSKPESSVDANSLLRGNGSEPESIDPQLVRSESAGNIVRDLYEGLLTEAADGSLLAGVAKTWTHNPETQCHDFILRDDARWSNGDSVQAEDFKRGIQFALNPKNLSPYSELLKPIKQITVSSPKNLSLCTHNPVPYFLELMVLPVSYPRHINSNAKKPITNGAYQFKSWTPQDKLILNINKYFHSLNNVYFKSVEYITTENSSSELKRFLAGELDITVTVPPGDVKRLRESHASELKIAEVLNTYFYGFNLSAEPFKDNVNLRKALSLAVDRKLLVEKILGTGETQAWTLVPLKMQSYQAPVIEYQTWSDEQRISEAKRLYALAGYTESSPVKFVLRYNTSPLHKKTAVALATMWKTILGAEVELYNEEWKVFVQNRRNKNTQMFRSGWIADVNDASNYLELLSSKHPLNDYAYTNSRYDELLEMAKTAKSKRISILRAAEEQMLQDQAIIPLYNYVSKHMLKAEIQGWEDNLLDHHLSRYLSRQTQQKIN